MDNHLVKLNISTGRNNFKKGKKCKRQRQREVDPSRVSSVYKMVAI